jgi:CysZ protein
LLAYSGGFITLILLSPVLAIYSEKTEFLVTGNSYRFNLVKTLHETWRGILISARNFVLELLFILLFFSLSFVPIAGLISPFALFLVTAYYFGFSMLDYSLERKGASVKQSIQFMRKHSGQTIGSGLPFALILLIPILGSLLVGFIAVIGVISASLSYLDLESHEKKKLNT